MNKADKVNGAIKSLMDAIEDVSDQEIQQVDQVDRNLSAAILRDISGWILTGRSGDEAERYGDGKEGLMGRMAGYLSKLYVEEDPAKLCALSIEIHTVGADIESKFNPEFKADH